jgi:hypothetical protein
MLHTPIHGNRGESPDFVWAIVNPAKRNTREVDARIAPSSRRGENPAQAIESCLGLFITPPLFNIA